MPEVAALQEAASQLAATHGPDTAQEVLAAVLAALQASEESDE